MADLNGGEEMPGISDKWPPHNEYPELSEEEEMRLADEVEARFRALGMPEFDPTEMAIAFIRGTQEYLEKVRARQAAQSQEENPA